MRGILVIPPQADADKGAAAVSNHHRDRQRHHGQGKHHRIGGIAIGAEIVCIGNENLIHNVVERRHQQRDDTGNSVLRHQLAHPFCFQKRICFCFHEFLPYKKQRRSMQLDLYHMGHALFLFASLFT